MSIQVSLTTFVLPQVAEKKFKMTKKEIRLELSAILELLRIKQDALPMIFEQEDECEYNRIVLEITSLAHKYIQLANKLYF